MTSSRKEGTILVSNQSFPHFGNLAPVDAKLVELVCRARGGKFWPRHWQTILDLLLAGF